jgi:hypothetical protein
VHADLKRRDGIEKAPLQCQVCTSLQRQVREYSKRRSSSTYDTIQAIIKRLKHGSQGEA